MRSLRKTVQIKKRLRTEPRAPQLLEKKKRRRNIECRRRTRRRGHGRLCQVLCQDMSLWKDEGS